MKGTVSALSHAHVAADGVPPADWNHLFAKDITVDTVGGDISLKMCADTSGNVTTS